MSKDYQAISDAQDKRAAELFRAAPEIMRGHRAVTQAAQTPSALDVKTTELMALAIAIVQRCEAALFITPSKPSRMARVAKRSAMPLPWRSKWVAALQRSMARMRSGPFIRSAYRPHQKLRRLIVR